MEKYVKFSMIEGEEEDDGGRDGVCEYAQEVLSLGLLYMEFNDAIREGDGERILRCWRYFLLWEKELLHRSFHSALPIRVFFTERMRMQLLWNRTVNVYGCPGKNIPCDLHMEHLNRECKGSMSGLGANITDGAIQRVGRSLRSHTKILENFDKANDIASQSGYHTVRLSEADIGKLLKQVHNDSKVFTFNASRRHRNFPNFEVNVVKKLSKPELMLWLQKKLQKLLIYH